MPYLHVTDFKSGLDTRRARVASIPGALYEANNVHVTRGGELEKRAAFVPVFDLPASTKGIAATAYNLYTFGEGARPTSLDAAILYQNLAVAGKTLAGIEDWDVFNGRVYVVARYTDGTLRHFYDGAIVTDWAAPTGGASAVASRQGTCLTLANKMYAGAQNVLFFSAVDNPIKYAAATPNQGQGFIDLSNSQGGSENITALAVYQGRLAAFTRRAIQMWDVDPDPTKYRLRQILLNLGTMAPRSVVNFGDADVFFLSDSGVRSLRARDSSNNAAPSDIGTPVDSLVVPDALALPKQGAEALAIIEPISGRYWLALGNKIYVFSFYPSAKVSAWTRYTLSFTPDSFALLDNRVYVRGTDNKLYLYGGASGQVYGTDYTADVELALLDAERPAAFKHLRAFDLAAEGEWKVYLGTDPAQPTTRELIGTVNKITYGQESLAVAGYGTHFSYRLTHQGAGRAALFSLITHYENAEQD